MEPEYLTESAIEFLARMDGELADEYKFRGVKYSDLCFVLAITIGKKLLLEGNFPYLEKFVAPGTRTRQLIPVRYETVQWGEHCVCVCDNKAWDPVLGRPEPRDSYSQALFGEKLFLQPFWDTQKIREYDERDIKIDLDP